MSIFKPRKYVPKGRCQLGRFGENRWRLGGAGRAYTERGAMHNKWRGRASPRINVMHDNTSERFSRICSSYNREWWRLVLLIDTLGL